MMNKHQLLSDVRTAAIEGVVSEDELLQAFQTASPITKPSPRQPKSVGITDLLYFLGGAVVFLGIVVLLEQHWSELSFVTRVLVTMGSGLVAYYVGLLFSRQEKLTVVAQSFFFISALVLPMGLEILFDHFGMEMAHVGVQACISGILFCFFLGSYLVFESNVFLLFSVLYGTWLFFSLTGTLFDESFDWRDLKFTEYRVLITGLSYSLLAYAFSRDERESLSGALYGFGSLFFLGAAFALGGNSPTQNYFWEFIFPGLILGTLFLSVYLKRKSLLTFGSLYLIAYISKMTVEYFKDSLGWPLSLVLMGFALMGIGYGAVRLNKEYIGKPNG